MPKCKGKTKIGNPCQMGATCQGFCKKHSSQKEIIKDTNIYHNHFIFEECKESCPLYTKFSF